VLLLLGFALLLALMLLLVLLAAIGLRPGGPNSLGPVPEPPRFEAAVGGAQPLRSPGRARLADRVVAPGIRLARPVSRPGARQTEGGGGGSALAVAPAQAVEAAGAPPVSVPPVTTAPAPAEAQPVAVPLSTPTTPPVVAGAGAPGGPVTAGVVPPEEPAEACEGVEYTVTVAFDVETLFGGSDSEILLRRVGSDGSEIELQAEGGLEDLNALLEQFAAEGECVTVEVEPLPDAEPAESQEPGQQPDPTTP
jgi:hypothetical protein